MLVKPKQIPNHWPCVRKVKRWGFLIEVFKASHTDDLGFYWRITPITAQAKSRIRADNRSKRVRHRFNKCMVDPAVGFDISPYVMFPVSMWDALEDARIRVEVAWLPECTWKSVARLYGK